MDMNDYQANAVTTAIFPRDLGLIYTALKLNGEAGEVAELVGKAYRDEGGAISEARREKLILELGDVLWYVANMARILDCDLALVARRNLDKLRSRKERGVLQGSGSDR